MLSFSSSIASSPSLPPVDLVHDRTVARTGYLASCLLTRPTNIVFLWSSMIERGMDPSTMPKSVWTGKQEVGELHATGPQ